MKGSVVILDTNAYSRLMQGEERVIRVANAAKRVLLCGQALASLSHSIMRLFDYSIISLLLLSLAPITARANSVWDLVESGDITWEGATTNWVDGDLILKWTNPETPGALTLPGYAKAWILEVGGGGAGGDSTGSSTAGAGGGGGAGGFVENDNLLLTAGDYLIGVGAGGARHIDGDKKAAGNDGAASYITNLTQNAGVMGAAYGGGGGGCRSIGRTGASGGGSSMKDSRNKYNASTVNPAGQGNPGGAGKVLSTGGGGGGADGEGVDGTSTGSAGGKAASSSITGTLTWYAGGGGGGLRNSTNIGLGGGTTVEAEKGGAGNGGNGNVDAEDGVDGFGGGGGGGGSTAGEYGGKGGSGVVIIRISWANMGQIEKPVNGSEFSYTGKAIECLTPMPDLYTIEGDASGVNVGSYHFKATLKPGMHWGDDESDTDPVEIDWKIVPAKIDAPVAKNFTFEEGKNRVAVEAIPGYVFSPDSVTNATDAGTYTYKVWYDANHVWRDGSLAKEQTIFWTIDQQAVTPPATNNFVFAEGVTRVAVEPSPAWTFTPESVTSAMNAGTNTFTVKLGANYKWVDADPPTPDPYTVRWIIARQPVTPPAAPANEVYDGEEHVASTATNSPAWHYSGESVTNATAAGTYEYTLIINDNYCWAGGDLADKPYSWTIGKQTVAEPVPAVAFCYDGEGKEPVETNQLYTLSGDVCQTNANEYQVTVSLKEPANYQWLERGDSEPIFYDWVITQRVISITGLAVDGWQKGKMPSTPSCIYDNRFAKANEPTYDWALAPTSEADVVAWKTWVGPYYAPTEAGNYLVRATIAATANWSGAVATNSFGIYNHPSECLTDHMEITLSGYTGTTALTNMPVLIRLSEKTGGMPNGFEYARAGANGENLCFTYAVSATTDEILPYEIDYWNKSGESLIWVCVPVLKPASEGYTTLTLYWAKRPGMAVPANHPTETWTNYVGVWHMDQGATSLTLRDATGRGNDATGSTTSLIPTIKTAGLGYQATISGTGTMQANSPYDGKSLTLVSYDASLRQTTTEIKNTNKLTIVPQNGTRDEVRILPSSLVTADWKAAEKGAMAADFSEYGLIEREGVKQDYWTSLPSITPPSGKYDGTKPVWDVGETPTIVPGALASGDDVKVSYIIQPYGTVTNELPTTNGEYIAVFEKTTTEGWSLVGGPQQIAFEILAHAPYPVIDEGDLTTSGRILLMNNCYKVSGKKSRPEVNYQAYYDAANNNSTAKSSKTPSFWHFYDTETGGGFNLKTGTDSILWTKDYGRILWHLKNCRHGNTYPTDNSGDLNPNQNYLPWEPSSMPIGNIYQHTRPTTVNMVRNGVGWIVMRNVADAAVYSGCFTNGVGTIYFDAVNALSDAKMAASSKLVLEYVTQTIEGKTPTDENCLDGVDEAGNPKYEGKLDDWSLPASQKIWKRAKLVPMLTQDGGDFVEQTATEEVALGVTKGGAADTFYRIRATLNIRGAVRFRIRRSAYDPGNDADGNSLAVAPFILLDNIEVSKPPQTANLVTYGKYDETKTGKSVVGTAGAFSEAFPAITDRGVKGRAKVVWGDPPREGDEVVSATMHYRWRYLDQAGTLPSDWKTVPLDPRDDFVSLQPLEYSQQEGDIEYYFTGKLKGSYYEYADYSGAGHTKPVGDFREELPEISTHYAKAAGETLPSGGDEWFVRLRNGKSDWEVVRLVITEGSLAKAYDMELIGDNQWRVLVPVKKTDEGTCRFHFRGCNRQTAGADWVEGEDFVWSPEKETLNQLPGSGKLMPEASSRGATFTLDHAAGYLEFKMSDRFLTFTVARAEMQDFNAWHDAAAPRDKFHVNYNDTNYVDVARMSTLPLKWRDWKPFVAEDSDWNENFKTPNFPDPGFPLDQVFITHDMPNRAWDGKNISFVSEKLVTKDKEASEGGMAGKLLGQGNGKIDFLGTGPDGLDTITFRARIGQSMTFDAIAWDVLSVVKSDYMFFTPATMSQVCNKDGNSLGDMAVGASISVIGYYFPNKGCYEFRVERPYKGNEVTLSLRKWSVKKGAMVCETLCTQRTTEQIAWTDESDTATDAPKGFYGVFLSCENVAGGTRLVGAISTKPEKLEASDLKPASHFSGKAFRGLVYTDTTADRFTFGACGVAAKDCPSQFQMPIRFNAPQAAPADTQLEDTDDKKGKRFKAATTLALEGASDTTKFYDCRDDIRGGRVWSLPSMRIESYSDKVHSPDDYWVGLHTPTNLSQVAVVQMRKKGETSESDWQTIASPQVKSYSLDNNKITLPVRKTGSWELRFTTGEDAVDVVFDDLKQTRWHAPNLADESGRIGDDYFYSQGIVVTNTTEKRMELQLQPARADVTKAVSLRSPILEGLGKITFSYCNAAPNAQIWVQVATNDVDGGTLTAGESYNESIQSVDLAHGQVPPQWMTLKKYGPTSKGCDAPLGTSGTKSEYLGWHNHEKHPVKGVFRLFVPTEVVTEAVSQAQTKDNVEYGAVTVTGMTVCDEPGLSERAWRGWNLRTIGDDQDSEKRMYIADMVTDSGYGMVCGLNNQTNQSSLVEQGEDNRVVTGLPAIYSPTFGEVAGQETGVGAVSFKARLYATTAAAAKLPGRIVVWGARDNLASAWTAIVTNEIVSTVFSNFTWAANGEHYSAIKFELQNPGYREGRQDLGRVIIDEIVISEKIQPTVSFAYARPFRQSLFQRVVIDDIESPNEQPLAGESWGVQTQLTVEQLEDEIDLSKGFRVFFSYYTGTEPWGYEQWKNAKDAVCDVELESVGEPTNLVYRSTIDAPQSLVDPVSSGGTVVQYMLVAKYWDRNGAKKEYAQPLTSKIWKQPDWFYPVDWNSQNGGYDDAKKFSAYTILDTVSPGRAWINEVNWNDGQKSETGGTLSETNQFVEICVPTGVDMKDWWVQLSGYSQDSKTGYRKTAKLFTFGKNKVPTKKSTGAAVNGYEFFVVASPVSKGPVGTAADGRWTDASVAEMKLGKLQNFAPYQFELYRPSGVLEHQFVLEGTNTLARYGSDSYLYDGQYLKETLDAEDVMRYGSASPHRFFAGVEGARKRDGTLYGSAGVVGGNKKGAPAPGDDGTWKMGLLFTPGALNEGQEIPEGWFLPPNGTNSWIYLSVVGDHIRQDIGGDTNRSTLVIVPQSGKTNVNYYVDSFYELAAVTVNGVTNAATCHRPGRGTNTVCYTYEVSSPTGTQVIVATDAIDQNLLAKWKLDPNDPYTPGILKWLGQWDGCDVEDMVPAHYQRVDKNAAPKHELGLKDMYWLDIPPFTESGESEWLLRAGVTQFGFLDEPMERYGRLYTNLYVKVKMFIENDHTHETNRITYLQGIDNARSDRPESYVGNWKSETFKVRGTLELGKAKFQPFRTFIFDNGSFGLPGAENEYESYIEILDPFSPLSPGWSYGWNLYPEKKSSSFWGISLDTDTQPVTTERLKVENGY